MLAKRFVVMPAATGLMAAKRVLIVGKSSAIRPGTFPSRSATRITAERRSRNRVGESAVLRSTTASTSAKVFARGDVVGGGTWVLVVMAHCPFGIFGVDLNGLG